MTRGRIVAIEPFGTWTTEEFNGDMYPEYHGKEVLEGLKKCETLGNYRAFCEEFNNEHFHYEGCFECEDGEEGELFIAGVYEYDDVDLFDFSDGYFDKWFSDWLYIKNFTTVSVDCIDCDGNEFTIEPGEIAAVNYGELAFKNDIPIEPDIDELRLVLPDLGPSGIEAYAGEELVVGTYLGDAEDFETFLGEFGSRILPSAVKLVLKMDMSGWDDAPERFELARECQARLMRFIEDVTWEGGES